MRSVSKRRLLAAFAALALTAQTPPPSYIGAEALVLVGQHQDAAGTQHGVGGGPLLELHLRAKRFAFHLEGIPVVSVPGIKPSEAYGQATPALGIINTDIEGCIGRPCFTSLGIGETIYNQRTPLPAVGQTVSSRLAGVRYVVRYVRPAGGSHFVEAFVGATPRLYGSDVYVYLDGTPNVIKPEIASEIDAQLAFGYRANHNVWLVGLRDLNFAAEFVETGEAADRNVGIGPYIEWRSLFTR
jgi:hypothetical protein